MKQWSLYAGSFAGIKVFIHWSFWIIIAWIFMLHFQMGHGWAEGVNGAVFVLALFGCVVLHEFGHALTAKSYGVPTRNITLYPIGGIASLEKMPDKPGQELAVALAGPAVNVVIAGGLYLWLKSSGGLMPLSEMDHMSGGNFWFNLMAANVILAGFNLIPAFPMDGGRVLRALLAYRMDKLKATNIAARIGQLLAIVFVFLGFFTNFWLVFIGFFIYLGAGGEVAYERQKASLKGLLVRDVMLTKLPVLSADAAISEAVKDAIASQERLFFVGIDGQIQGVTSFNELLEAHKNSASERSIGEIIIPQVEGVSEHTDLNTAVRKLMGNPKKYLAVTHGGQVTGAISQKHIEDVISIQDQINKKAS